MIYPYLINLLIFIAIYIILTLSFNLALGYTGLLNLGHIAFFGIGAYASSLLSLAGLSIIVSMLFAGVISAICGLLFMLCTNKLSKDYFALASLAFSFVVTSLTLNWVWLTNGAMGLRNIPNFSSNFNFLIFATIVCAISVLIMARVVNSPFGKLMQALRDDQTGLKVLGKNTSKIKFKSLAVSTFFAGIAGSLFAHYISYIEPASFEPTRLIFALALLIIGGLASVKGSIFSPIILMIFSEIIRFLPLSASVIGPFREILYSLILIIVLIFRPRGIFGRVDV